MGRRFGRGDNTREVEEGLLEGGFIWGFGGEGWVCIYKSIVSHGFRAVLLSFFSPLKKKAGKKCVLLRFRVTLKKHLLSSNVYLYMPHTTNHDVEDGEKLPVNREIGYMKYILGSTFAKTLVQPM